MGRLRRLADAAIAKMDEIGERETAKELAGLTPAQRENHEAWQARGAHFAATGEVLEGRLVGQVLMGPAGEALHGVRKAPKPPVPIEDPEQRRAVAAAERAARAQARAPYVAGERRVIRRHRFDARPGEQLAANGLAGRPDLVYGVYRVPDGNVDEWEVVHCAQSSLPPAPPPAELRFDARDRWVERRVGEPCPYDEEIPLGYLAAAGLGPEHVLGINRDFKIESHGGDDSGGGSRLAVVKGVRVWHAGAARPAALAPPAPGVHQERLNWEAVARAVAPVRRGPEPVPSPWPYLPLTSGELLEAYLEVVGIDPADSYGAQVTYGRAFDLMGRTHRSGHVRIWGRGRVRGGSHVVITYRDRPEYVAGRERWAAYCRDVLHAELWRRLSGGEPVPKPTPALLKWADRAHTVASLFDHDLITSDDFEELPRYCWPPVD